MPRTLLHHPLAARAHSLFALFVLACTLAPLAGCEDERRSPSQPADPPRPEAEVKFDHIYDDVNRLVGTDELMPDRDHGGLAGGTNTQWSHKVEKRLVPPADESGVYQGVITITRRYSLTMYAFGDSEDKGEEPQGSSRNQNFQDPMGDAGGDSEVPEFDYDAPSGARPLPGVGGSPIKQREGEDVKTYDLEYRDGAWRLLTVPDPETESAIKAAFEYALRRQ